MRNMIGIRNSVTSVSTCQNIAEFARMGYSLSLMTQGRQYQMTELHVIILYENFSVILDEIRSLL